MIGRLLLLFFIFKDPSFLRDFCELEFDGAGPWLLRFVKTVALDSVFDIV